MFQTPELLDPAKHAQLKLSATPDYRFTAEQIFCPVFFSELWQIAREYLMVFSRNPSDPPLAVLGLRQGENAYSSQDAPQWKGRYIPAHFRRYPFILAPLPATTAQDGQRFAMLIERAAPHFSEVQGQPLFTPNGAPTKLLLNIQKLLGSLENDSRVTCAMTRQIDEAGLLIEQGLTLHPVGLKPVAMHGFRIVDQTKLRALEPELLCELAKTRALDLIYAHICSLTNLHDGLLAQGTQPKDPAPKANEGETIKNDDLFSFDF